MGIWATQSKGCLKFKTTRVVGYWLVGSWATHETPKKMGGVSLPGGNSMDHHWDATLTTSHWKTDGVDFTSINNLSAKANLSDSSGKYVRWCATQIIPWSLLVTSNMGLRCWDICTLLCWAWWLVWIFNLFPRGLKSPTVAFLSCLTRVPPLLGRHISRWCAPCFAHSLLPWWQLLKSVVITKNAAFTRN